jgi:DNA modification methylase
MVKLADIKLNKKNPRKITDRQMDKLVASIESFPGMMELRPIVVDAKGVIIGGNMRYEALKRIGKKEVPNAWVKNAAKLTDEERRRFIVEDNVGFGEWDYEALSEEWTIGELTNWGLDIPKGVFGVSERPDDDDVPEEVEPVAQVGDIFTLGRHRVMCGDSREDIPNLIGNTDVKMVFADPPYGVAIGAKNRMLNSVQKAGRNLRDVEGDEGVEPDDLQGVLAESMLATKNAVADDCSYYITSPQGGELAMMMMMMMKDAGLPVRHVLIWAKHQQTFSLGRLDYEYKHEPILYTWGKSHTFYGQGPHRNSVWEIPRPTASKLHPTMKPVALIENALLNSTDMRDEVFDPFLGSGSTLIACEKLNRTCYGMEIDPHYVDVTIKRWEDYTGEKAKKVS